MNLELDHTNILEPCCGGGHMVQGIVDYILEDKKYDSKLWRIKATDIMQRDSILRDCDWEYGLDFLSDDYPYTEDIDYVIMNPPFKLIEPFCMKALPLCRGCRFRPGTGLPPLRRTFWPEGRPSPWIPICR